MGQIKVGDRVLIDPKKCITNDLDWNASTGTIGEYYTVEEVDEDTVWLEGANWHRFEWLTLVNHEIYLGGE